MFRGCGGNHLCAKILILNPFGQDWSLLIWVFALLFGQDTSLPHGLPHCDSPGLLPPQMPLSCSLGVMCRLESDHLINHIS